MALPGFDEIELESEILREKLVGDFGKPYGGIIVDWCFYRFDESIRAGIALEQGEEIARSMIGAFTGRVVGDKIGRWRDGSAMLSSAIRWADFDSMLVVTGNRVYQLAGPGRVKVGLPGDYDLEVGVTIMFLASVSETGKIHVGDGGYFVPRSPYDLKSGASHGIPG